MFSFCLGTKQISSIESNYRKYLCLFCLFYFFPSSFAKVDFGVVKFSNIV
jgi:hypothetical protein